MWEIFGQFFKLSPDLPLVFWLRQVLVVLLHSLTLIEFSLNAIFFIPFISKDLLLNLNVILFLLLLHDSLSLLELLLSLIIHHPFEVIDILFSHLITLDPMHFSILIIVSIFNLLRFDVEHVQLLLLKGGVDVK